MAVSGAAETGKMRLLQGVFLLSQGCFFNVARCFSTVASGLMDCRRNPTLFRVSTGKMHEKALNKGLSLFSCGFA